MTRRIHVLSDAVKNLIAAGEVVERPASILKELVENAIDAGARTIDVEVEGGGRTRIAVSDDGTGMIPEDATHCVARHATSKLEKVQDLKAIDTLGFRGEALPAIASVSDLTIVTRSGELDHATEVRVRFGKQERLRDAARAPGTTVTVRNLFAMTPARSKFLKSKATELRWISQVFTAYAMAYPDIAFSFTVDGKATARHVRTAGRRERVEDVLGTGARWIHLGPQDRNVRVEGLISEPDAGRSAARHIFFYVNRRWVSNRPLLQTLLRAYAPFAPKGRYPAAVIYLDVAREEVDVNVHPTKREVKFREAGKVCNDLFQAVEETLRASRRGRFGTARPPASPAVSHAREERSSYGPAAPARQMEVALATPGSHSTPSDARVEVETDRPTLLTTLGHTYLVAVDGEDLVLVDQHAAHERVLYEEAENSLRGSRAARQSLLLPLTLDLTPDEAHVLAQYGEEISSLGFEISAFGGRSILVEAIPAGLHRWDGGQILRDILDEMGKEEKSSRDPVFRVAASFACHASVRAGDPLDPEQQKALLTRLFACRDWHRCPHGRPTVVRVDRAEIEKRFRRP